MKTERLSRVVNQLSKKNISQMLISDPATIFYLTGKWIDSGQRMLALYLDVAGGHKLFVNELFPVPEDLGVEKIFFNDTQDGVKIVSQYIDKAAPLGVDKNWPARFLLAMMAYKGDSAFINASAIVDNIRACKDEEERAAMREVSRLNDLAIGKLIQLIPGRYSENKLAQMLSGIYEEVGADGCSFAPIIAYGANAASPHHEPGHNQVQAGDCVIMDIGCKKAFYCSDMTRTVFYKYASEHAKKVYGIVADANKRAIDAVKPGVRFCDIDAAARNHIEAAGYGKGFVHRTGHSIGLEVHEFGDVSAANTGRVQPGNIFSIEPSIIVPGELGIRVEDLVLVTNDGCEVLNSYPKELMVVE